MIVGALVAAAYVPVAPAEDEATTAGEPAAAAAADVSPVAQALSKLTFFNGEPAKDAKYYIFLESASWCGPCRAEMPRIARAYPGMREKGVELVLIGRDFTPDKAKEYLKTFKAEFPGIFVGDEKVEGIPGFSAASYVPHAVVVDSNGKVLADGHGSITLNWQKIISDHEAAQQ